GWFYLRGGRGDPKASNPDLLAFYTENAGLAGSIWLPPNLFTHWSVSQYVSGSDDPNGISRFLGYDNDIEGPPADVIWSASATALVDLIKPEAPPDPARPAVTWQLSPQGDVGDKLSFDAEWASGETTALTWTIEMPPVRAATMRMVQLPDDLAAYRGDPALTFDNSTVYLRDYVGVEGWLSYQRGGSSDEYRDSAAVYYPPSEPGAGARQGHRAPSLTELRRRHQPAPSGQAPSRSARHAR
ncbi:MAG TPA: hypothetical protein VFS00_32540, partial [Polyangiaceae bacterium]|nr:hypothetical protein [Polyangiaceae bacterium]